MCVLWSVEVLVILRVAQSMAGVLPMHAAVGTLTDGACETS